MCSVAYNLMFYVYNENFYKIAYNARSISARSLFSIVSVYVCVCVLFRLKVESVENKIKWNLM